MPKPRGRSHTTLTETAHKVVHLLSGLPGITMIAPGEIRKTSRSNGGRFVTIVETVAGVELLITGQSVQRVAVHTIRTGEEIRAYLENHKSLRGYNFALRVRRPGV
jgi:hypothetical protein